MFDHAWLLTWTTYANWLPGDPRGFVSSHPDETGDRVIHNEPGTEIDRDIGWLRVYCRSLQSQPLVRLNREQAVQIAEQLEETAAYRGWSLRAMAIMANHVHVVVLVPGDPDPETLLHSFKSYATRRLNARFGSQKWWTRSGSKRKLADGNATQAAVAYVRDQEFALHVAVWDDPEALTSESTGEPRQS